MALPSLTSNPWGPYTDLAHIKAVEDALGTGWLSNPGMPTGVEDPFAKLVANQNTAISQEFNQQKIDAEKKRVADEAMAQAEIQAAEGSDLDTISGIAKKLGDVQLMMNVEKEKSSRANIEADNKRAQEQSKNYIYSIASQYASRGNTEDANRILAENGLPPLVGDFRQSGGGGSPRLQQKIVKDPNTGENVLVNFNPATGEMAPISTYKPKETASQAAELLSALGLGTNYNKQNGNPTNTTTDSLRQASPMSEGLGDIKEKNGVRYQSVGVNEQGKKIYQKVN